MSPYTVNVSDISPTTSEAQLHDFFTFCGKITSIEHHEKSAIIAFEKSSAAKTALMLNGGTLDGATLTVTSDVVHPDEDLHRGSDTAYTIDQSDKPRAGIAAEYLAKGYVLSDHILERAIELDNKQGISKRFLDYFRSLDKNVGERTLGAEQTLSAKAQQTVDSALQQAKVMDEQKGYSKIAHDYYSRAIASPLGQKVRAFYTSTSKQVLDIHEEARRIAEEEKKKSGNATQQPGESNTSAGSAAMPNPETQKAPTVV